MVSRSGCGWSSEGKAQFRESACYLLVEGDDLHRFQVHGLRLQASSNICESKLVNVRVAVVVVEVRLLRSGAEWVEGGGRWARLSREGAAGAVGAVRHSPTNMNAYLDGDVCRARHNGLEGFSHALEPQRSA